VTCDRSVVFSGYFTNKTLNQTPYDIAEILLKVALNTINQTWSWIIAHLSLTAILTYTFYKYYILYEISLKFFLMVSKMAKLNHVDYRRYTGYIFDPVFTGFVTRVTRLVPYVEQELLTLPGHLSSLPVFSGVYVYLVFCEMFCRLLLVFLFFFVWPLYCLSFFCF
jgi:hypothetical protein